jgi:hypothetical protein
VGGAGVLLGSRALLGLALGLAALGLALLAFSLAGLYRMYGHPSLRYYRRLFAQAGLRDGMRIADLHIGTYRTTFALAELYPGARISSVDCWDVEGPPAEPAVADVRALEAPPTVDPRIRAVRAAARCPSTMGRSTPSSWGSAPTRSPRARRASRCSARRRASSAPAASSRCSSTVRTFTTS